MRQRAYSERFRARLEAIQGDATAPCAPVRLSFYPIAKNIRLVGTALADGLRVGHRSSIVAGNPREAKFLELLRWGSWNPWLWSRIPGAQLENMGSDRDDPTRSWTTYFRDLNERGAAENAARRASPAWNYVRDGFRARRILEIATATRYAFRLNDRLQTLARNHAYKIGYKDGEPKLGLHLRRGDAASEDLSKQTRPSFSLESYLSEADRFCERYGLSTIYLSTESEAEIRRAEQLRPGYRILSLDHDRSIFPRLDVVGRDIEQIALDDPSVIEPIVNSAIFDLYFLSRCDAFIGAFNSEFSVLAWLLCIGEKGHVVPYEDMVPRSRLEHFQGRLEFNVDRVVSQFFADY
jgi:hypothetical protein